MLTTAYCTVEEANTVNNSDAWNVLLEQERQTALNWGRVYLDSYYSCGVYNHVDLDDIDDEAVVNAFKAANAVLGDKYANDELFEATATTNSKIAEKQVKAGSVSTRTKYADPAVGETYDPFPEVSAILSGYCTYKNSGFQMHPLIRA